MSLVRFTTSAALALGLAVTPLSAMAQGKGNKHERGAPPHAQSVKQASVKHAKADRKAGPVAVVTRDVNRLVQANCPPGLAKKDPACIPPGQAKKGRVIVGDNLDLGNIHIITNPGLYGLGAAPTGTRYAIVGNQIVRVDSQTGQILSIIRLVEAILD